MPTLAVPSLADVAALAERALGSLTGQGQASVLWERRLTDGDVSDVLTVTVTAVQDGRTARVSADGVEDAQLARAAKAAVLKARQARAWPAPPLPPPATGRPHEGFESALLRLDPAEVAWRARAAAGDDLEVTHQAVVARTAVASSTGVRAAEQRSHVLARLQGRREGGRTAAVTVAGVGEVDVTGAAAEVRALLGEGDAGVFAPHIASGAPVAAPDEVAPTVVLGPEAVAAVVDQLRAAGGVDLALGAGPLAGRRGTPVAAPSVSLSDAARFPGTLPRSYDAEGVPRRPVVLIRDGIAHGQVHDSSSAARAGGDAVSSGHATQAATLAPYPDHLVLLGGGDAGLDELCAPVADGIFIPALGRPLASREGARRHETAGAARIRGGVIMGALAPLTVEVAALEVLAAVEALSGRQRLVPLRGQTPGGSGAAVVCALRTGGGLRRVA